jgi:acyl carrier protein
MSDKTVKVINEQLDALEELLKGLRANVEKAISAAVEAPAEAEDDEVDLEKMDLKALLAYAKENDIEIPKKDAKKADKVREIIEEAIGDVDDDEEDDGEIDLDGMSLKDMLALAKENEIKISKKDAKDEDKVREILTEALVDDDEDDSEEDDDDSDDEDDDVDLDSMSLKELLAYAKENEIEIPKKDAKKADKVRELIEAAMEEDEEGDEDDDSEDDEVDLEAMSIDELLALA